MGQDVIHHIHHGSRRSDVGRHALWIGLGRLRAGEFCGKLVCCPQKFRVDAANGFKERMAVSAYTADHLPRVHTSLLAMLVVSFFHSLRARFFGKPAEEEVLDADFEPFYKQAVTEESKTDEKPETEETDEELNRIVGLFKLSREAGYTLRLIPGTPEENAPVFDFAAETIVQKAA